jgi:hypothetical protein
MPKSNRPGWLPTPAQILRKQRKAFRRKFGRDWQPDDPVFFDPDQDQPAFMSEEKVAADVLNAMRRAGTPPQIVYAYRKTGLLISEVSRDTASPEALAEWDAAITEYFRLEDNAGKNRG